MELETFLGLFSGGYFRIVYDFQRKWIGLWFGNYNAKYPCTEIPSEICRIPLHLPDLALTKILPLVLELKSMRFVIKLQLSEIDNLKEKKTEKKKKTPRIFKSLHEQRMIRLQQSNLLVALHVLKWKFPEFQGSVKQLPFIKSIHSWHFPVELVILWYSDRNVRNCQVQV